MKSYIFNTIFFSILLLNFTGCRDIFSDETQPQTIIQPPSEGSQLVITDPAYGTIINPGDTILIKWIAPGIKSINIQLYIKSEYKATLDEDVFNNGTYSWKVPFDIQLSHHYRIKILSHTHNSIFKFSDQFGILN